MKTIPLQLETEEHVLLQVRKHWFVLGAQLFSVILIALAPLIFYTVITLLTDLGKSLPGEGTIMIILYTVWLLIMWMALFNIWTNYYLDVWTITNKRVIAVDQRGLFSRTTGSFRLERLQDIIIDVHGIIPTLLNFGSVEIQTAGEEKNFKVFGVPAPSHIKALILSAVSPLPTPPSGV